MKILFWGTPDFAVTTLDLLKKEYDIVGVVTATDKSQKHGNKTDFSPVKKYALQNNLTILQPENLKNMDFLKKINEINADVYIVVGFRLLPECIWSKPKLGTINLHAALLPKYKGAAPINWAIINGEKKTGVSTFFINNGVDTGDIIYQDTEEIYSCDTFDTLKDRLKIRGANLMLKTIKAIENNNFSIKKQQIGNESLAPKINKEECKIIWDKKPEEVCNFINGLSENPGAFTFINKKRYKILFATPIYNNKQNNNIDSKCGEIYSDKKNFLYIAVKNGYVSIEEIQPEGKNKMSIKSFLAGYNKILESWQSGL